MRKNEKRNGKALLPIVVFVVLYLGLGILFEYGLDIEMGFYKIPVVVIFLHYLLPVYRTASLNWMISWKLWGLESVILTLLQ